MKKDIDLRTLALGKGLITEEFLTKELNRKIDKVTLEDLKYLVSNLEHLKTPMYTYHSDQELKDISNRVLALCRRYSM